MKVVGHTDTWEVLRGTLLPPALLFVGPKSVGKTTLAFQLVEEHGFARGDILYMRKLTAETAKTVARAAFMSPKHGEQKVLVVNLDAATHGTTDVLLKAVEDCPPTTRFIFLASSMPKQTIAGRCHVFRFNLLDREQVAEVLVGRGFDPTNALRYASVARGQVRNALRAAGPQSEAKTGVLVTLRALIDRDVDTLNAQARRWTDEHVSMMTTLGYEVITGEWRVFQAAEVEGVTPSLALKILTALAQDVRPRLMVHSSLMKIVRGEI